MFECYTSTAQLVNKKSKNDKTDNVASITLGWIHTRKGSLKTSLKSKHLKRVKVLFDTGCDATLINKKFVKKIKTTRNSTNKWNTKGGVFKNK